MAQFLEVFNERERNGDIWGLLEDFSCKLRSRGCETWAC